MRHKSSPSTPPAVVRDEHTQHTQRDWPGARCCATFVEAVADLEAWVLRARAQAQVEADDARRPTALAR
jgi:hypothetical protein